eukprot:TRINITY_DN7646_c0_g1_i1.p1 TRINITY_DN7646_c0_g1~~TRINITY_DN7646_c0_g1_i1.p1  ORF type:complete len:436 (+),score=95.93 TRINITY_DN7646_c0_g1_i1:735-2042(+)
MSIFHRDLKPENILIFEKNPLQIKLGDFTFARELEHGQMTNTFCGSFGFMAPEILSREEYTAKSDLWSVGVIMYRLYFNRFPWASNDFHSQLFAIRNNQLHIPDDPNIPHLAISLIERLLIVDPILRLSWSEFFVHEYFARKVDMNVSRQKYDTNAHEIELVTCMLELEEIKNQNQILMNEITALREEKNRTKNDTRIIEILQEENNILRQKILDLEDEKEYNNSILAEELRQENAALKEQNDNLKSDHEELRQKINNGNKVEYSLLGQKIKFIETELEHERKKVQTLTAGILDAESKYEDSYNDLLKEKSMSKGILEQRNQLLQVNENINLQVKTLTETNDRLRMEYDQVKNNEVHLAEQLWSTSLSNSTLSSSLAESNRYLEEMSTLRVKHSDALLTIENLEEQLQLKEDNLNFFKTECNKLYQIVEKNLNVQ